MKVYFTRSQSRSMSADHPVGDPTGGPAYGEYRDPVSMMAIYEVATTGGAVLAMAEGGAAVSFMTGLTFAGGAMALVGKATGNKDLMALGAVAGLAGGIGNMLTSAPMPVGPGDVTPLAGDVTAGPTIESPAVSAVTSPVAGGNPVEAESFFKAKGINLADPTAVGNGTQFLANSPQALTNPNLINLSNSSQTLLGLDRLPAVQSAVAEPGLLTRAMDWAGKSPMNTYVAAQAIGGAADMMSGMTPAKIAMLKAQTAAQDFTNQRNAQGIINLNQGATTVSPNISITPNTMVSSIPQPTGLINTARAA